MRKLTKDDEQDLKMFTNSKNQLKLRNNLSQQKKRIYFISYLKYIKGQIYKTCMLYIFCGQSEYYLNESSCHKQIIHVFSIL